jgi:hypothetical protein
MRGPAGMTDKELRGAIRALPHMTVSKAESGEYRVAYLTKTIATAKPEWGRTRCEQHQERTAYYTEDREDALGTAKSLSDHMVGILARMGVEA